MRIILFILQKEFRQIFRNKGMLPIIFIMPVIQLIVLVNAADFELKNIRLAILDNDHTQLSQTFINKISSNSRFTVQNLTINFNDAITLLDNNEIDVVVRIPMNFTQKLFHSGNSNMSIESNAIDGQSAGITVFYLQNITSSFNKEIIKQKLKIPDKIDFPVTVSELYWYNPDLDYKQYMVPGLLVILVSMIGVFLASMNIVREIEIGTIEQINVTPIKKYQFIIGKLFPFWVIGLFEFGFGLTIGKIIYDITIAGNLFVLFTYTGIYLFVVLGMGLLVSTLTKTQQQAMFVSWFFIVIFILMSGLFTPIENMPSWAQKITWFNPIAYFVDVVRLVLLKGSSFSDILPQTLATLAMAVGINFLAIMNYRKRS